MGVVGSNRWMLLGKSTATRASPNPYETTARSCAGLLCLERCSLDARALWVLLGRYLVWRINCSDIRQVDGLMMRSNWLELARSLAVRWAHGPSSILVTDVGRRSWSGEEGVLP